MGETWRAIGRAADEALSLVFPIECAGCGALDQALCADCRALLVPGRAIARRLDAPAGAVCVWSGLPFDGAAARAVRALKEEGRTALARALAPALAAGVAAARGADAGVRTRDDPDVVVTTIPTSRAAMRRRGFRVVDLVARRGGLRPVRLLRATRVAVDQRSLGRTERSLNTAGTMAASPLPGLRVIVLDDVVTTGATLVEAVRALRAAGAEVVGAATIAATPRRFPPSADTSQTRT